MQQLWTCQLSTVREFATNQKHHKRVKGLLHAFSLPPRLTFRFENSSYLEDPCPPGPPSGANPLKVSAIALGLAPLMSNEWAGRVSKSLRQRMTETPKVFVFRFGPVFWLNQIQPYLLAQVGGHSYR